MNVTEAANAVHLGSRDATIVWDVVAANYPDLVAIRVPELDGAVGPGGDRPPFGFSQTSSRRDGSRIMSPQVIAAKCALRESGFTDLEAGRPWTEGKAP